MQARRTGEEADRIGRARERCFVLLHEGMHGSEMCGRPTFEARIADRATLVDRFFQDLLRLGEARSIGEDVAEVHLRVGDRLLRTCCTTRFEVLARDRLRAREVAELGM